MISPEVADALRTLLRQVSPQSEEECERMLACWRELRESERKPRKRQAPDKPISNT